MILQHIQRPASFASVAITCTAIPALGTMALFCLSTAIDAPAPVAAFSIFTAFACIIVALIIFLSTSETKETIHHDI